MKCNFCGAEVIVGQKCEYCGSVAEPSYYGMPKIEPPKPKSKIPEDGWFDIGPNGVEYMVKKGDNLWSISQKFYGKGSAYAAIVEANKDVIRDITWDFKPGIVLKIPPGTSVNIRKAGDYGCRCAFWPY